MDCFGQIARSRALLVSLAHRSKIRAAAARRGAAIVGMASSSSPAEADLDRTSTETRQLLDRLARSDSSAGVLRVAVVGDVHGAWSDADAAAMRCLEADCLAFVGDFGNEAVPVVDRISKIAKQIGRRGGGKVPGVAVVCGNHDAWNSMTERGRERGRERALAAAAAAAAAVGGGAAVENDDGDDNEGKNASGDPLVPAAASPGVAKQLRLLGKSHVGFSWRAFGEGGEEEEEERSKSLLAVVGGRPFSQGGPDFNRVERFYREMYGVEDFKGSTERIVRSLREAAAHLSSKTKEETRKSKSESGGDGDDDEDGAALVLIAHNGPSGLGKAKHDICGADFLDAGGDWGDPDLEEALRRVRSREGEEGEDDEAAASTAGTSFSVSASPCLVAFGHMHRSLRHASSAFKERNAVEICAETGTVFLNAAAWPRARELSSAVQRRVVSDNGDTKVERVGGAETPAGSSLHHAVVVEVDRGVVTSAHDAWVTVSPATSAGSSSSSSGEVEGKKKKATTKLEATRLEMRELLRTERARGVNEKGQEVFFRSIWRGWTREFELMASRVPASAPKGWNHWRFRE